MYKSVGTLCLAIRRRQSARPRKNQQYIRIFNDCTSTVHTRCIDKQMRVLGTPQATSA